MSTPTLKFKRQSAGVYWAYDDTKCYGIRHDGKHWVLSIRNTITTAGVQHSLGQPVVDADAAETMRLAVATARVYSELGDDYKEHENGHASRMTKAVTTVYAAEVAAMIEEAR